MPNSERDKLDSKARRVRFIGYCQRSKGYRLCDEHTRKLIKSRDVKFDEREFLLNSTQDKELYP